MIHGCIKDGVGAGCSGQRWFDEFQADILVIKKCTRILSTRGIENKIISICTDSQSALKALDGETVSSRLVADNKGTLQEIVSGNKLNLAWIPGHAGCKSNERADKLANKRTRHIGTNSKK